MTSTNEDWIYDSSSEDLSRYQNDGIDLRNSINAGQRISDLRGLAEISVSELAANSGITDQELLALEAGIMTLQPELARRLAGQLGVAYEYLYVDEDNEK